MRAGKTAINRQWRIGPGQACDKSQPADGNLSSRHAKPSRALLPELAQPRKFALRPKSFKAIQQQRVQDENSVDGYWRTAIVAYTVTELSIVVQTPAPDLAH